MLLLTALPLLRALVCFHAELTLENPALRNQLAVLRRHVMQPQLRESNRLLWIFLSRVWKDWRPTLVPVKPETVAGWHWRAFKLFWKWNFRRARRGRPAIPREIIHLIRHMADENPLWSPSAFSPSWLS
jgi:putative transposase